MRLRSLPPVMTEQPRPDWAYIFSHVILCQGGKGRAWPDGTVEAIAEMIPTGASQDDAVRIIEDELWARDVGGTHFVAHGAGI